MVVLAGGAGGCAHGQKIGPFAGDRVASPTAAVYASVDLGWAHGCGVRRDGALACWGRNDVGQASPPPGERWSEVVVGALHSCALSEAGEVVCWGAGGGDAEGALQFGQAAPTGQQDDGEAAGGVKSLTAGAFHTCALLENGAVRCWGLEVYGATDPPEVDFESIDAGADHTCGMSEGGEAWCWGLGREPWRPFDPAAEGNDDVPAIRQVAAVEDSVCGIGADERLYCRRGEKPLASGGGKEGEQEGEQADEKRVLPTPTGRFDAVDGGGPTRCGRRPDGSLACWRVGAGRARSFQGPFAEIAAGPGFACGRTQSGRLLCRGGRSGGAADPAGEGAGEGAGANVGLAALAERLQIGRGGLHLCVRRQDGTIRCRAPEPDRLRFGQAAWPDGTYVDLAVGDEHNCAVAESGEVVCWGRDDERQVEGPSKEAGPFFAVAVEEGRSCALRRAKELENGGFAGPLMCWGAGRSTPWVALSGMFTDVVVTREGACGLGVDGRIQCTDGVERGRSEDAGDRSYRGLYAGDGRVCGLGRDGRLECWTGHQGAAPEQVSSRVVLDVAVGARAVCVLEASGRIRCGSDGGDEAGAVGSYGPFVDLAMGGGRACGLRADGVAVCWKPGAPGERTLVSIPQVRRLEWPGRNACGLRADGLGADGAGLDGDAVGCAWLAEVGTPTTPRVQDHSAWWCGRRR